MYVDKVVTQVSKAREIDIWWGDFSGNTVEIFDRD